MRRVATIVANQKRSRAKPRKAPTPAAKPQCLYVVPGERQCPALPELHGYCHKHIRESPQERAAVELLSQKMQSARAAMDDLGYHLLAHYIVHSAGNEIPEASCREYRTFWHRHTYLKGIRDNRRPGDDLPAEVTMR